MNDYTKPRWIRFDVCRAMHRPPRVMFLDAERGRRSTPDIDIYLRIGEQAPEHPWLLCQRLAEVCVSISRVGWLARLNGVHFWRPFPFAMRLYFYIDTAKIRAAWSVVTGMFFRPQRS